MKAHRDRDGDPVGLSTLSFTGLWMNLSFYGSRALLAIYMITSVERGGRGLSDGATGIVMALYLSSSYLLRVPGDWIGRRFLGPRRTVAAGGIAMVIGNALLALPVDALFYGGLVASAIGIGLVNPNMSTMVSELYEPRGVRRVRRDRRDRTYYLVGWIGVPLAPIAVALLAQSDGVRHLLASNGLDPNLCWRLVFALLAVGMAASIALYLLGGRRLGDIGRPVIPSDPREAARDRTLLASLLAGIAGAAVIGAVLDITGAVTMTSGLIGDTFGIGLVVLAIAGFWVLYIRACEGERRRVIAMIPLFIGGVMFAGTLEQASTTIALLAERLVSRHVLGISVPASAYQSLNPLFSLILIPLFSALWRLLARRQREPSNVTKFAIGMLLIAGSFAVMLPALAPGAGTRESGGGVHPMYLGLFYLLGTTGGLCISGVALSTMLRLAPFRAWETVWNTWSVALSFGAYLAGRTAGLTQAHGFALVFYVVVFASLGVALLLFAMAPVIRRMLSNNAPELEVASAGAPARVIRSDDRRPPDDAQLAVGVDSMSAMQRSERACLVIDSAKPTAEIVDLARSINQLLTPLGGGATLEHEEAPDERPAKRQG